MEPFEKMERRRQAQRRLSAQRRRASRLRGRAVAISAIAFVLLWGAVFGQMASGNDPVLGSRQTKTSAPRAAAETIETSAPEQVEAEVSEPEPIEAEAVEVEVEPEPAPVTTSQS